MPLPKPYPEALKWMRERDWGDYVDPDEEAKLEILDMADSIMCKLTDEELEFIELAKIVEAKLNPKRKEWSDTRKEKEAQRLWIYIDYLWLTESLQYGKNKAYEKLTKKYRISADTIKRIVNSPDQSG